MSPSKPVARVAVAQRLPKRTPSSRLADERLAKRHRAGCRFLLGAGRALPFHGLSPWRRTRRRARRAHRPDELGVLQRSDRVRLDTTHGYARATRALPRCAAWSRHTSRRHPLLELQRSAGLRSAQQIQRLSRHRARRQRPDSRRAFGPARAHDCAHARGSRRRGEGLKRRHPRDVRSAGLDRRQFLEHRSPNATRFGTKSVGTPKATIAARCSTSAIDCRTG